MSHHVLLVTISIYNISHQKPDRMKNLLLITGAILLSVLKLNLDMRYVRLFRLKVRKYTVNSSSASSDLQPIDN